MALYGTKKPFGPNIGTLSFEALASDKGTLSYHCTETQFDLTIWCHGDTLYVEEDGERRPFGMGVSFSGEYKEIKSPLKRISWILYELKSRLLRRDFP